jgi:G3E family GTPase
MKDLTKAELIEKLEEQQHLVSAVEAKDIEMSQLKKESKKELEQLKKKHEEEIQALKKEKGELVTKYQGSLTKEQIEKVTERLVEERNEAILKAKLYIKIHHDLLKQIQHTTEMALFSEQLVSEKFKIRGDK